MGYLLTHDKAPETDPLSAVPSYSGIIIETVDIQSFFNTISSDKGLFGEIKKIEELSDFSRKLKLISDNLNKPEFRKLSSDGKAVISVCNLNNNKTGTLFSVSVPEELSKRKVRQILSSSGFRNCREVRISHKPVLCMPAPENPGDTLFFSGGRGLFLIANSASLMRDALKCTEDGNNISAVNGFKKVYESSGEKADKIFLVFRNLSPVIKPLLSFDKKGLAETTKDFAYVFEGDIAAGNDGMVLNGYILGNDTAGLFKNIKNTEPAEFRVSRALPSSTVLFSSIINDGYFIVRDREEKNLEIKNFIGNEITRAYIDLKENPIPNNELFLYSLKDTTAAREAFLRDNSGNIEVHYFNSGLLNIPVYMLKQGLTRRLFPGFSTLAPDTCVSFYKNYMVTGSSFKAISEFLDDNLLNNTLSNDISYTEFENTLPSRGSYFFFCKPSRIIGYLDELLSDQVIDLLRENKISLNKIQSAGVLLSPGNGMIYSSVSFLYRDQVSSESFTEWETLLDTKAATRPFFFTNHLTGAREIFVQDINNTVYLINASGRMLWKVPLQERILGNVFMIDFYGNGKNQLLFSGKNNIHLLDRNGNYVEQYPVKLKSPATNPVALFDYENNGNYRLIVAGEDRLIYCFDKTGSAVKGWKPFRTAGLVRNPLSYFRVAGKDYIIASDDKLIYLLDRFGNKRLTPKEPVVAARGTSFKLNDGSESYFVCSSPSGKIQQIYFDGAVKKFSVGNFSSDHSFDIFDVNGDGLNEYIYTDKGKFFVYDHNRKILFSREIGSSRISGPVTFSFSATEKGIGFLDPEKNLIYLINNKGDNMNGFPLSGASLFSIARLTGKNNWNLIVGSPDRFLYNYILTL